jgi:hypothetical protein
MTDRLRTGLRCGEVRTYLYLTYAVVGVQILLVEYFGICDATGLFVGSEFIDAYLEIEMVRGREDGWVT